MHNYYLKLFYVFMLLLLPAAGSILGFNGTAQIKCIDRERQALLNFIHDLVDAHDMLSTWRDDEKSRDCCKWKGIQCDHQTGHVTILRLRGSDTQYLRGALNITSLFPLQNIQHLDLSYNEFIESHIPELMGSLTNLRYLNLSYSSFGGNIPTQLGSLSHLLSLDLSNNCFLRGDIPYQLVSLTNLRYLDLSYNNLDGKIPCQLGNMSQLRYLGLSANSFSGALPFQVGNLPYLKTLRLGGDFDVKPKDADWLSSLSSLTHLAIDGLHNPDWLHMIHYPKLGELRLVHCSLSDTHIHSLFYSPSNFSNSLTILDLSSNMLTSSTFQLLSNFSLNLQELYLSHNNIVFSSPVHSTFPSLVILDLSYNKMSSSVFQCIFNFSSKLQNLYLQNCSLGDDSFLMSAISITNSSSSLVSLDLSFNLLKSSSIFYWLFNSTTNLRTLELNDNMLEGPIPDGFGKEMNSLEELYLSHNNIVLSSPVHSTFPSLVILDLSYNKMSSSIFQCIFNFSSKLQNLYLQNCSLGDDSFLMSAISITNSSSSLVSLDLSFNLLKSSSIFYWLFNSTTNLRTLELNDNMLEGPIPDGFGKEMNSLEVLSLFRNKLQGEIPSFFGNMCTLQSLDLSNNKLSGQISSFFLNSSWCNRHVFRRLLLSGNNITGRLPKSIGLLSELIELMLAVNYLEGDVTESHLSNFSKLSFLQLSDNSLSLKIGPTWFPPFQLLFLALRSCNLGPTFPNWLQTQTSIIFLDISNSNLNDSVPDWFWNNLQNMGKLNMSYNNLIGTIPNISLKLLCRPFIFLHSNQFEGKIPPFLLQASKLKLSKNKFSNLFSFLCDQSISANLLSLDLSNNQMKGQLPNCWKYVDRLLFLDLSNNKLSGKIHVSMGSLVNLEVLVLRNNNLMGELPSTLKNCSNLIMVDVSENILSGPIPSWIGESMQQLIILNMRGNHFSGHLPVNLCYLKRIQSLDLSRNNLSRGIPTCLKNLTVMSEKIINRGATLNQIYWSVNLTSHEPYAPFLSSSDNYTLNITWIWKGMELWFSNPELQLKSIDLSSNNLTGEIPKEIGYLIGLVSLNLSRNHLSGEIPSEIGNLSSLESLDLSRNHISGAIPFSLSQIDNLGKLDLSHNSLSGKIPRGRHFGTFEGSSFEGNVDLCGEQLNKSCPRDGDQTTVKFPEVEAINGDEDSVFYEALYMSMGIGFFTGFWGLLGPILLWHPWRNNYIRFMNRLINYIYERL